MLVLSGAILIWNASTGEQHADDAAMPPLAPEAGVHTSSAAPVGAHMQERFNDSRASTGGNKQHNSNLERTRSHEIKMSEDVP